MYIQSNILSFSIQFLTILFGLQGVRSSQSANKNIIDAMFLFPFTRIWSLLTFSSKHLSSVSVLLGDHIFFPCMPYFITIINQTPELSLHPPYDKYQVGGKLVQTILQSDPLVSYWMFSLFTFNLHSRKKKKKI